MLASLKLWRHQFESAPLPERIIEVSPDPMAAPRIIASGGQKRAYIILRHHHSATRRVQASKSCPKRAGQLLWILNSYPKAIADAIDITRRLGYQYLWIRQLCLTTSEFSENLARFLGIYGRASLKLTASISSEPTLGLFHGRNILHSPALRLNGAMSFYLAREKSWRIVKDSFSC